MRRFRTPVERHDLFLQRICYLCHAPIELKKGRYFHRFSILVHADGICDRFVDIIHKETYGAGKRWPAAVRRRLDDYWKMPTAEVISRVRALLWM